MSAWVRLWEDMPNDPKWRVVARRASRPVSEVLAVFVHMLTNAGAAAERGSLQSWSDEDVAIAIDADPEHVAAIREAMQGKTLEGDHLTGWEKRQPKREDGAAERAKEWRERKKAEQNAERTRPNAAERKDEKPNAPEPPEEKRVEENNSDLRSGAQPAPLAATEALDEDPKKILFSDGLRWLAKVTGKSEGALRPLIGRMLRDIGGDAHAGVLLGIFRDAKRECKGEPVSWIAKMIQGRRPGTGPPLDGRRAVIDMLEGMDTNGTARNQTDFRSAGADFGGNGEDDRTLPLEALGGGRR